MNGKKDTLRDHVGIVHGLAWTAVGGVTLKIEVNVMPGKGAVQVTGIPWKCHERVCTGGDQLYQKPE